MGSLMEEAAVPRATFGEVFGLAEFRALWLAQLVSVAGDQLARVAITLLVFDRTRSSLLAAVTFAVSVVPSFLGGVTLSGLADRRPRRQVMVAVLLTSGLMVAVMILPGIPLPALLVLLFAVTMIGSLFSAARAALYPEILHGDRFVLGTAVTQTTNQFAQVLGFAVGGVTVAFLGVRTSLLADAATFGVSALMIRVWVRARPAARAQDAPLSQLSGNGAGAPKARRGRHRRPALTPEGLVALRIVFSTRAMRTPLLFGMLSAFYNVPDGVATPLARAMGGGAITVGLILAAQAFGQTVAAFGFSRLIEPPRRLRWTAPLAMGANGALLLFAVQPPTAVALVVLAVSGMCACYQIAAQASFVQATPPALRGQAFGIANGGMGLGQGAVIIAAGAAAAHATPALVVAATGCLGILCTLLTALSAPARPVRDGAAP
jgi:Major Facilitator Superfamily